MKRGFVNKSLYEARIKKGVSRKEASIFLHINRIHLKLIEEGYLNVPKRKYDTFIKYYELKDDFFSTHSTYVEPIEKEEIDFEELKRYGKRLINKKLRVFCFLSVLSSTLCVAFGIYANNRRFITPRIAWTQEFTQFTDRVKSLVAPIPSYLNGDNIYKVSNKEPTIEKEDLYTYTINNSVTVFEKDMNAENTNIDSSIEVTQESKKIESYSFYLFSSNKKKVIFYSYTSHVKNFKIDWGTLVIEDDYSINLRPFDCVYDNQSIRVKANSEIYKAMKERLNHILPRAYIKIDKLLIENELIYFRTLDLLDDIQKISRDNTLFSRLGVSFICVFTFVCLTYVIILCLSYYSEYQLKHPLPKLDKKTLEILNYDGLPTRTIYQDSKFPSVLPEFMVRIFGLSILLVSSISMFLSVYTLFNIDFMGFSSFKPLRDFSSNFLSSAVLLLFFIKLDIYYRKNANQLITNIVNLFVFGLIFYIAEVMMFNSILREENIFSIILYALYEIMPGNVIWNIMLYFLIFYFLFTTPRKFVGNATKVIKWRLCSLIPTFFLIFALFYKFFFEPRIASPIYISLIFHTSGIIPTSFAIVYLYSLYFINLFKKLSYGLKHAETYSYSRRYALNKNILASIIILILFAIDMFFRYNIPDNVLKLGQNWAIICLIPIILFYRPHIGKRNIKWDNIYTLLYGSFFAGGYISIAIYLSLKLNISDIIFIRL